MATPEFNFVHFTDTHVMAGGTFGDFRLDTADTLRCVISALNALELRPAFAVVGGDLVSPDLLDHSRKLTAEEYEPSYRLLRELTGELAFPAHFLLGNHDHRGAFHRVMDTGAMLDAPHRWAFDRDSCHFVGLDSHVPGATWGELDASQLEWLRGDLAVHRGLQTFVFVHHHPWPIGVAWLDAVSLRNGDSLVAVLGDFPDARWIVCGHVHQDQAVQRGGLTMWTTPSTCFQMSKLLQARNFLSGPPGFRLVNVSGETVRTRVIHLSPGGIELF